MNPLSDVGTAVANKLAEFYGPDLEVLGIAILSLVAAIVGLWFLLRLFGVRVGLSETAKQRIRDRAAKRKAAFPLAFSYVAKSGKAGKAKAADASGPWMDPANSLFDQEELWERDAIHADYEFFANLDISRKTADVDEDALERHMGNVIATWSVFFPNYRSLDGLGLARSVDDVTKIEIFRHASRLVMMRFQALESSREEWAKAYAGDYESRPMKFIA